jgi:hypothetical protein
MTLSELIQVLEAIRAKHGGDLPVFVKRDDRCGAHFDYCAEVRVRRDEVFPDGTATSVHLVAVGEPKFKWSTPAEIFRPEREIQSGDEELRQLLNSLQ